MRHVDNELTEVIAVLTGMKALHEVVNCPSCMVKVLAKMLATVWGAMKEIHGDEVDIEVVFDLIREEVDLQMEIRSEIMQEVSDELKNQSNQNSCKFH